MIAPGRREHPGHTEGETVMLTLMTFTLFVLALALPGLITLVITGTTEVQ
jgi:hypothetical protein